MQGIKLARNRPAFCCCRVVLINIEREFAWSQVKKPIMKNNYFQYTNATNCDIAPFLLNPPTTGSACRHDFDRPVVYADCWLSCITLYEVICI